MTEGRRVQQREKRTRRRLAREAREAELAEGLLSKETKAAYAAKIEDLTGGESVRVSKALKDLGAILGVGEEGD